MPYQKLNLQDGTPLTASHLSHIETGIEAQSESIFKDKKISIMGDSISTFKNYIPSGNSVYYTGNNCGVTTVDDTWWKKVINALNMTLCVNQSWSGSSVTDCKSSYGENSYGHTDYRTSRLSEGSSIPDVIIIYMGTNDLLTLNKSSVGTYNGSTDTMPTDIKTFREAYAIMLNKIITNYPEAKLYCCTLIPNHTYSPTNNVSKYTAFNEAIKEVGTVFGAEIINLSACGINAHNLLAYLPEDGGKLHPNPAGHSLIANQVIKTLDPSIRTRY